MVTVVDHTEADVGLETKVATIQVSLQIPQRSLCYFQSCWFLNYKAVYCLQLTCIAQLWFKFIAGMIKLEMCSVLEVDFGLWHSMESLLNVHVGVNRSQSNRVLPSQGPS